MPPQIKNKLLMRGAGGQDGRVEVEIPGCGSMVLPDTYEPEKFERPETKTMIDPETLNVGEKVQKVATEDELHRLRFAKMMKEVDKLKTITSDIESYRQIIEAAHNYTEKQKKSKSKKIQKRNSSAEVLESNGS